MRSFVYGKMVKVYAYKTDGYYPFACARTVVFSMDSEIDETTNPSSPAWRRYKPSGMNGWTIDLNAITVLQDPVSTLWFSWELMLEAIRANGLDIKVEFTDKDGNSRYATGFVFIPKSGISGSADDISESDISFLGSGSLTWDGTLLPSITMGVKRISWVTTGSEPNVLQDNGMIGLAATDIYEVSLEGDDKYKVITVGTPTERQVLFNSGAGTLTFKNDFDPNMYAFALVKTV